MKKLMKKMYETKEVKDIWCDFCKKQIKTKKSEFYSGGTIDFRFAYGSNKDDIFGCFEKMDICDECFDKIFLKYYAKNSRKVKVK